MPNSYHLAETLSTRRISRSCPCSSVHLRRLLSRGRERARALEGEGGRKEEDKKGGYIEGWKVNNEERERWGEGREGGEEVNQQNNRIFNILPVLDPCNWLHPFPESSHEEHY